MSKTYQKRLSRYLMTFILSSPSQLKFENERP